MVTIWVKPKTSQESAFQDLSKKLMFFMKLKHFNHRIHLWWCVAKAITKHCVSSPAKLCQRQMGFRLGIDIVVIFLAVGDIQAARRTLLHPNSRCSREHHRLHTVSCLRASRPHHLQRSGQGPRPLRGRRRLPVWNLPAYATEERVNIIHYLRKVYARF